MSVSSCYVGGRATYSCNTGYALSGSFFRTCLPSGSWSGSNPCCRSKLVYVKYISCIQCLIECLFAGICSTLTNPSNGRVSVSSYFGGSRATYSCNTGYGLTPTGSSSRTCLSSGSWSGSNPSCRSKPVCVNYLISLT